MRSRNVSSPFTGRSDLALSRPMEVPRPPLSLRTIVSLRKFSPPLSPPKTTDTAEKISNTASCKNYGSKMALRYVHLYVTSYALYWDTCTHGLACAVPGYWLGHRTPQEFHAQYLVDVWRTKSLRNGDVPSFISTTYAEYSRDLALDVTLQVGHSGRGLYRFFLDHSRRPRGLSSHDTKHAHGYVDVFRQTLTLKNSLSTLYWI